MSLHLPHSEAAPENHAANEKPIPAPSLNATKAAASGLAPLVKVLSGGIIDCADERKAVRPTNDLV